MSQITYLKFDGTEHLLEEDAFEQFQVGLRGSVVTQESDNYNQVREVWNAMVQRRPAIIVRAQGVSDIIHCIKFAKEHQILTSIRGGGHNISGNALVEKGLTIDLTKMKGVRIDLNKQTVRAEGGVVWRDLLFESKVFGLATSGSWIPNTGVAGSCLGGGLGFLQGQYGYACDNLVEADLVDSNGNLLHLNEHNEPELFWGIRGGGGNFGVVTSLELKLHKVAKIYGGIITYSIDKASEFLQAYRDVTSKELSELTTFVCIMQLPDGTKVISAIVCYNGSEKEAKKVLNPLSSFATPLQNNLGQIDYFNLQNLLEEYFPQNHMNFWKSSCLKGLDKEIAENLVECYFRAPTIKCCIIIESMHGRGRKVAVDATAYSHRKANYNMLVMGVGSEAEDADKISNWALETYSTMQKFSTGAVHASYLGASVDEQNRIKDAYTPQTYDRLIELKKKYDPDNFFRINHNIKPD